ncbi:hypothetical protein TRVA0_028S00936 [Trichomonascus vanleenenianus]|uniref:baculoviral IAP repeat-containing protein n=1 Tax=Trichomonascus vanleenenianus TaxID=2268995 RepID=UPI003ECB5A81
MAGKVAPSRAKFRTQEARIATFNKDHKITGSSGRGKQTVKWPLEAPDCESLALSGFYYDPLADALDRTTCYACGYSLDGWEESDDPTHEHYELAKTCCLAMVQYRAWLYMSDDEMDPEFTESEFNPHCDKMVQARKTTFLMNNWPHDKKKGWFATSERLAKAGFYCNLEDKDSDLATCAYCELSLDGWEPKDDPVEEHRRRTPDCIFFTTPEPEKKKKSTRSKKRSFNESGEEVVSSNKRRSRTTAGKGTRLSAFDKRSNLVSDDDDDDLFKGASDMKEVEPVGIRSKGSTSRRSAKSPSIVSSPPPPVKDKKSKKSKSKENTPENKRPVKGARRSKTPKEPVPEPSSDSYSDDIDDDDEINEKPPESDSDEDVGNAGVEGGDNDPANESEPREDKSDKESNKENEDDRSIRSDKFFDANEFSHSTSIASRRASEFDVDYSSDSDLDSAPELETDFEISPVKSKRIPGTLPSMKGRILFPIEAAEQKPEKAKLEKSKKPEKVVNLRKSEKPDRLEQSAKPEKSVSEKAEESASEKQEEPVPELELETNDNEELAIDESGKNKIATDKEAVEDEPGKDDIATDNEAVEDGNEVVEESVGVVEEAEQADDESITKCEASTTLKHSPLMEEVSFDGTTAVESGDKVASQNPEGSPGGPTKQAIVEEPPTPIADCSTTFITQSGKAIDWNMSDPDEVFDVLESLNMSIDDESVLDLTVAQYIKHISYLSTQQLEAKSQRLIGMIKQQGERALQVLQDLETED